MSTVDSYTLTADRLVATAAVLIALAGAIVGAIALARRAARRGSMVALAAGVVGFVVGGIVVVTADGGPGTGNGIVGGYMALLLGLVAAALGGMALRRGRLTP